MFPVGSLFRLRVSHHLDHAAFPAPATSHAACGFPHYAPPFASCQDLWDLSCWGDFLYKRINPETPEQFGLHLDVYSPPQVLAISSRARFRRTTEWRGTRQSARSMTGIRIRPGDAPALASLITAATLENERGGFLIPRRASPGQDHRRADATTVPLPRRSGASQRAE